MRRVVLTLLIMGGMLSAASAGALRPHGHHYGWTARHAYGCDCSTHYRAFNGFAASVLGWALSHDLPHHHWDFSRLPHRRARGSSNTDDANAVQQRLTDEANQRARDDSNAAQQPNPNP
jgi:hypothetical protein